MSPCLILSFRVIIIFFNPHVIVGLPAEMCLISIMVRPEASQPNLNLKHKRRCSVTSGSTVVKPDLFTSSRLKISTIRTKLQLGLITEQRKQAEPSSFHESETATRDCWYFLPESFALSHATPAMCDSTERFLNRRNYFILFK